jgi:aminopeptidase N
MDRWRKYAPALREQMKAALTRVANAPRLSKDLKEVITKSLGEQ